MDDSSAKMRANMEKVLRAMDVIPPLGSGGKPQSHAAAGSHSHPEKPQRTNPSPAKENVADHSVIPKFDLGEKILAEQRRLTARRRKAPTAPEPAQDSRVEVTPPVVTSMSPSIIGPSEEDLFELQQIVADIVARDIERLCTGPVAAASY